MSAGNNDLSYSVGLDGTDLSTGVTAIEARLAESGVLMSEIPAKYAKASAEAFNETYVAEDKLAKFRADSAFARMTDEEKLAVLRHQALGLLDQIQKSEGQSAEKANLQLQFEGKKNEIYGLNQKIQADSLQETKDQTEEVSKHPGLLGKIEEGAQSIKKAFHEMGVSLHGVGIGLIVAEVINLGKEAVTKAQETRDQYELMGKSVSGSTRTMAALGDALGGVKHAAVEAVGFLVGGFTQLGDLIGSGINRMRGISEAQENIAAAAQRAADAATARVEKLKEEQVNVEKVAAARKAYVDAEHQAELARGSDEQKFQALLNENFRIRDQIRNTVVNTVLYYERENALLANGAELNKLNLKLIEDKASKDLARIQATAPLDITYQQKVGELLAEHQVLLREKKMLADQHVDTTKVDNELAKNGVDLLKLNMDYRAKAALSEEDRIFMFKVEHGLLKNMTDQDALRYQILQLQTKEKRNQIEIDDLIQKRTTEGLTPAESARLKKLFEQNDAYDLQIAAIEKVIEKLKAAGIEVKGLTDKVVLAAGEWGKFQVSVHGGPDAANMSTAALQGQIDKLKAALTATGSHGQQIGNSDQIGEYGDWLTASNIRGQLNPLQRELDLRNEVAAYDKRYGDAATTAQYGDAVTQRALAAYTASADKTNTVLQTISDQLKHL